MDNIDLQKIADHLDFDLEDVVMLIEVFKEGAIESLKTMEKAIESNDLDTVYKSAHSIKGSSANLTLNDISNIAKDIEINAKEAKEFNYQVSYNQLEKLIISI